MDACLEAGLRDDLLEVLVVEILGLQVAISGDGTWSCRHDDVLRALEILGDLVEEGLTRILDAD